MTGNEIRAARMKRGWTQAELAERLGRSQPFVSMVERGRGGSPRDLKKIGSLLGLRPEEPSVEVRSLVMPEWSPASPELPLPVAVRTWQRPAVSGDCLVVAPVGPSGLIVAALDVVGGSQVSVPAGFFLKGWLRGWLASSDRPRRIGELAEHLERALRQASIEAAYFLGLIQPEGRERTRMVFETARHGFPQPLLLEGVPARSVDVPLLVDEATGGAELTVPKMLVPPWRLILGSDGLLRRLGVGSEVDGRRRLLRWNEGPTRDLALDDRLATSEPGHDDESCFVVEWAGWTLTRRFDVADTSERHRVCREVSSLVGEALGQDARTAAEAVLIEALQNARRHAYSGPGIVTVRMRDFARVAHLEIEDEGRGGEITDGDGVRIMRHRAAALDVRRRYPSGTIVLAKLIGQPSPQ